MKRGAILAAIVLAIASAGCKSSSGSSATTPSITITPIVSTLEAGNSLQFGDTITNESTSAVTWLINGQTSSVAQAEGDGTISVTGLYQSPEIAPSNVVNITVEVTADTTTFATAAIVVTAIPNVAISPTTETLAAASPAVPFTFTVTFFPTPTMANPAPASAWEVDNVIGGNSTIGTIDQNGDYTPPPLPPPGGNVVVTVFLVNNPTQSASAAVTLTYGAASMHGSYAFSLAGQNASGFFSRAGQFTADGVSALTGIDDIHTTTTVTTGAALSGSYTVGPDGRGTARLSDGTNYDLVVVSANQVRLIEADSSATAHGQADLQNSASFNDASFSGGYAFDFFGTSGAALPTSDIGQFTATGATALVQSGLEDINAGGALTPASAFTGNFSTFGPISASTGRGTVVINGGATKFNFYMISAAQARFIETDASANVVGDALQQSGAANAGFLSSLNVFTISGRSTTGKVAEAGLFFADGAGGTPTSISNGLADQNNNGVAATLQYAGTYSVAASGRGTASFTSGGQTLQTFVIYFVSPGQGFIQETDSSIVGDGVLLAQRGVGNNFSTLSLTGSFALNWTGAAPPTTAPQDATGQLTVGTTAATVSGTWDRNDALVLQPNVALTGIYFLAVNGRGTLTLTDPNMVNYDVSAYVVNNNTVFLVGTDPALVFLGQLTRQF